MAIFCLEVNGGDEEEEGEEEKEEATIYRASILCGARVLAP